MQSMEFGHALNTCSVDTDPSEFEAALACDPVLCELINAFGGEKELLACLESLSAKLNQ